MKKIIYILIFLILYNLTSAYGDTHIPGGDVSGLWTIDGSPFIIDGHINVPEDSLLAIDPGVEIYFSGFYFFRIYGKLHAEGTISDSITFSILGAPALAGAIHFSDSDITLQDSSLVKYCIFNPGYIGFQNSSNVRVENCIISNGFGVGCENSSPSFINVIIDNNIKEPNGGGILCLNNSNPIFQNVIVSNNTAEECGGGIYCENSFPSLENVQIFDNSSIFGAGIYCDNSNPVFMNVDIYDNCADTYGGGMYYYNTSNNEIEISNISLTFNEAHYGGGFSSCGNKVIIHDILISNNTSIENGGGVNCEGQDSELLLKNVMIQENTSFGTGGGLGARYSAIVTLVNCIITDNYAENDIGAIYVVQSAILTLINSVVADNFTDSFIGGIMCELNSNLNIMNSIVWNNQEAEISLYNNSSAWITYSDIGDNGWPGTGNITAEPSFYDDEYHLSINSACIDMGNPDSLYYDMEDPDNSGFALYPALGSITNDMGAYGGHGYNEPFTAIEENTILINNIKSNNYPNPFNPSTIISFSIKNDSNLELSIFNIKGQKVLTLINEHIQKGKHSIVWSGVDEYNDSVSSGIYLYKIKAGNRESVNRMLLLK
ncbi:right-handed parallel beta-helix repeat-containing protein [Candidatus Cloacimonadota bacterium]